MLVSERRRIIGDYRIIKEKRGSLSNHRVINDDTKVITHKLISMWVGNRYALYNIHTVLVFFT